MLQTIIVYILIFAVVVYAVFTIVKSMQKKEKSPCDDCNGCDLKREITKNNPGIYINNTCDLNKK